MFRNEEGTSTTTMLVGGRVKVSHCSADSIVLCHLPFLLPEVSTGSVKGTVQEVRQTKTHALNQLSLGEKHGLDHYTLR